MLHQPSPRLDYLPFSFQSATNPLPSHVLPTASRQVCSDTICEPNGPDREFSVTVSAFVNTTFTLEAELLNRSISLGQTVRVSAAVNRPAYFRYAFGDQEQVTIRVTSPKPDNTLPATVSLQNGSCPIYDLPSNVQFTGVHQTVTRSGSFYLERSRLGPVIFIVLVVRPENQCGEPEPKDFEILVEPAPTTASYWKPIGFLLALFIGVPYLSFIGVINIERLRGFGFNEKMPPHEWIMAPPDAATYYGPDDEDQEEDGFIHIAREYLRSQPDAQWQLAPAPAGKRRMAAGEKSAAGADSQADERRRLLQHQPSAAETASLQSGVSSPLVLQRTDGSAAGANNGTGANGGGYGTMVEVTSPSSWTSPMSAPWHETVPLRPTFSSSAAAAAAAAPAAPAASSSAAADSGGASAVPVDTSAARLRTLQRPAAGGGLDRQWSAGINAHVDDRLPRMWNTGNNYTREDVRYVRGQQDLRVNHLTRKLPKMQEKKFNQYAHILLSLMFYYALPVSLSAIERAEAEPQYER